MLVWRIGDSLLSANNKPPHTAGEDNLLWTSIKLKNSTDRSECVTVAGNRGPEEPIMETYTARKC